MLPQILSERQLRTFKFWFNSGVQDGLHHQNELYYRAKTVDSSQRMRLYQLACRLSDRNANLLISAAEDSCSLWISLRNQELAVIALRQANRCCGGDSHAWANAFPSELLQP